MANVDEKFAGREFKEDSANIDEKYFGRFYDGLFDNESKTFMKTTAEMIEIANRDGITTEVTLKLVFKPDKKTRMITPISTTSKKVQPSKASAPSFNLSHTGQLTTEMVDPLSKDSEAGETKT